MILLLVHFLMPIFSANAQGFRQIGDEFLDTLVMESAAIIEADFVSPSSVRVRHVLLDSGELEKGIANGTLIEGLELPPYNFPLFASAADNAAQLATTMLGETGLYPTKVFLFLQPDSSQTARRYQFPEFPLHEKQAYWETDGKRFETRLTPYLRFGKYGHYLYGQIDEMRSQKDEHGRVLFMIRDFEKCETGLQSFEEQFKRILVESLGKQQTTAAFPIRRYVSPSGANDWQELHVGLGKAISQHERFLKIKSIGSGSEKEEFYLNTVAAERLYSNYALEELLVLNRREVNRKLLELIPRISVFVDDALETVLSRSLLAEKDASLERLSLSVAELEALQAQGCQDWAKAEEKFRAALSLSDTLSIPKNAYLFVSFSDLLPLLKKLYEVELGCFIRLHSLSEDALSINYTKKIGAAGQKLLHSGALTMDELGLLETAINVNIAQVEKQKAALQDFVPRLTNAVLSELSTVPLRLRDLAELCLRGAQDYENISLPDLRRSSFVLWKESCERLRSFHFPESDCAVADRRLLEQVAHYGDAVKGGILQAMEHDDPLMLELFLGILRTERSTANSAWLAQIISASVSYEETEIRDRFLAALSEWPFYSVAAALAEEYKDGKPAVREKLDKTLQQVTGSNGKFKASAYEERKWSSYLGQLKIATNASGDFILGGSAAVRLALQGKPCDQMNLGWNKPLREVAKQYLESLR